ncbi:MAG TPA: phosphohistidine phosphatase SixA [Planctomycetaceae bacterium]|nr:phosphohistidine phosphatase SixA [Planctomycetaceae bacterium]
MKVWFVRHAEAEDADAAGSDSQRALTARGRRQFREVADWLLEHAGAPELILTSPLVRAVQTAQILAEAAELSEHDCRIDERVAPGIAPQALIDAVMALGLKCVAVVGHEPDMSRCTSALIGGGSISFPKGGVTCIEFEGPPAVGAGSLRWMVTPRLLRD